MKENCQTMIITMFTSSKMNVSKERRNDKNRSGVPVEYREAENTKCI